MTGWKCLIFLLFFITVYTLAIIIKETKTDYFAVSFATAFLISGICFIIYYADIYFTTEEPRKIIFPDTFKNFKDKYLLLILAASIPLGLIIEFANAKISDYLNHKKN